jgi:hypothetical protein
VIAEGDLPSALSRLGWSDDNVDGSLGKGPGYICTQVLAINGRNLAPVTGLSIYAFHELFINVQYFARI